MNSSKSSGIISRNQCKSQMNALSQDEKLGIMEALDHLFVTKQYKEIGSCSVCKKICVKNSFDCVANYCSVDCQNSGSPKSKTSSVKSGFRNSGSDGNSVCSSALVNRSVNGGDNICHNEKLMTNNDGSPFKALLNQMNKRTGNPSHENHSIPSSYRLPNESKSTFGHVRKMLSNSRNDCKKFTVNKEQAKKLKETQAKVTPNSRRLTSNDKRETDGSTDEDKNRMRSPLRSDKIITDSVSPADANSLALGVREVTCTFRENENRYWVMDVENTLKYAEIQTILAKECYGYERIGLEEGLVCGCNFAGEWYRGKVVSVSPKIVHFIDYGNTSDYEFDFVKKLPESLKSFPGLAFLIEFEQGSPNEYKFANLDTMNLTVEETRKTSDGVSCVKIINGYIGPTTEGPPRQKIKSGSVKERSVLDVLAKDSKGMIFFAPGGGKIRFGSVLPDGNKNANECLEQTLQFDSSNLPPIEGKEGDYVLVVDQEGNDQRGKIISKLESTYYVLSTDCGNVLAADVVFPMPAKAKDLVELGAKVTTKEIFSKDSELEELDAAYFHITGEQVSGKWPCALKRSSDQKLVAKGFIEKPPETVEANPNYVNLKSGCTVEISGFCSGNSLYVRAIGAAFEAELLQMNNVMREYAAKTDSFTYLPDTGHLCCVKFLGDGCFYRAQVLGSVNAQKVTALFVDFGNKQETDLINIKPLPEALKKIPFFAVKVTLSKVPSKPYPQAANEYIKKLVTEGAELLLTYKESISKGVTLKEKISGVIVNDFIKEVIEREKTEELAPDKSAILPKDILTDEDLKCTTLALNSRCDLFLLYINGHEFCTEWSFWATDGKSENLLYVLGQLTAQICAHCAANQTPYHPTAREICLAEFEGVWYRALTVDASDDVFTVFFLDFGNSCEVKSKSIRKMEREFIKAPVLAINCVLNEHQRSVASPQTTKKVLKALGDRVNSTLNNVHVTKFEDDAFFVTIPEIQEMLSSS